MIDFIEIENLHKESDLRHFIVLGYPNRKDKPKYRYCWKDKMFKKLLENKIPTAGGGQP